METGEIRYLKSLAKQYPTIPLAATEIINLQAILSLPKGTEHFITDIHGEYDQFRHIMKNGSGAIKRKIEEEFSNSLSIAEKKGMATLIYYPKLKLKQVLKQEENMEDWYKVTLYRLIRVCKNASSKYTRSKVRKALPKDFAYVIEELLTGRPDVSDQEAYYNEIINSVIRTGRAGELVVAFCNLIRRLVVDHLHVVGDIYDRGPYPNLIMDTLMKHHSVDIQWGNHDVLWMGAAAGQRGCIANAIRICARYGNLDILEDGYGINLLPLASFAIRVYETDPCTCFTLKGQDNTISKAEMEMNLRIHKAISVIQFKVEGQIVQRQKGFHMENRALLHRIDYEKGTITLDGKEYAMLDMNFPTIDPKDPYALSEEEEEVMERLERAFLGCEKLQEHMRLLLTKGNLYKVHNNNLLYHGCVPLNEDGSLREVSLFGHTFKGRSLYDALDRYVRKGFFALDEQDRENGKDIMWYIWLSPDSPLFGKDKMATFERYFLAEKETHVEKKNPYYKLLEKEDVIDNVMREFGLSPESAYIVNGHVPVKRKNGESPVKCNGKVMVIDGGFSKAYQKETGIAGYTLIYNSYGLRLVAHEPFESTEAAIERESDIHSESVIIKRVMERRLVGDTDAGMDLRERISDLEALLAAYRSGEIKEKR